jgi:hypothetical protein
MIVPDDRVVTIEAELIRSMKKSFKCVLGHEYFEGNEKEILTLLTAKFHELYTTPEVSCDVCTLCSETIKRNTEPKQPLAHINDIDKEEIKKVLQYETDDAHVIDTDDIAKWLNLPKFQIIRTLKATYKENVDYKFDKSYKFSDNRNSKYGGNNYKKIMVTPDCFKRLCMRSRSTLSDELHTCLITVSKPKD